QCHPRGLLGTWGQAAGSEGGRMVWGAWRVPLDGIDALAVGESVVVAACPAEMHGLQAKSGDALWRVDGIESDGSTMLAVRDGVVRCWAVSGVHSFELRTGRAVHDAERGPVGARRRT